MRAWAGSASGRHREVSPAAKPVGESAGLWSAQSICRLETLNPTNLQAQRKYQNLNRDYSAAIQRLHDNGVMVNAASCSHGRR